MPPKVQSKSTYKYKVKLCLERLKQAVNKTRKEKQIDNNTSNSNTYEDGVNSGLERLK